MISYGQSIIYKIIYNDLLRIINNDLIIIYNMISYGKSIY